MFDLKFTASEPDATDWQDTTSFQSIAAQVRTWLISNPDSAALRSNLLALKLALAAHLKNRDAELLILVQNALARITQPASEFTLSELAELIRLHLFVNELSHSTSGARPLIDEAIGRFDAERGYFKRDEPNVFYTDENAHLAEVFYYAWRMLDDQQLRTFAGIVLGQVSDLFDSSAGLYQRAELSDGARTESRNFNAYASAIQMFLTASESTARRTYVTRACILVNYVMQHSLISEVAPAPVALVRALIRLEQFTGEPSYRTTARDMLKNIRASIKRDATAAEYALAVQELEQFPLHIAILGDVENDANAREMWLTALKQYAPARAIEVLNPQQHMVRIQQLGYAPSKESALAYVCVGSVCLPPVRSTEALLDAIARVRANL